MPAAHNGPRRRDWGTLITADIRCVSPRYVPWFVTQTVVSGGRELLPFRGARVTQVTSSSRTDALRIRDLQQKASCIALIRIYCPMFLCYTRSFWSTHLFPLSLWQQQTEIYWRVKSFYLSDWKRSGAMIPLIWKILNQPSVGRVAIKWRWIRQNKHPFLRVALLGSGLSVRNGLSPTTSVIFGQ